MRGPTPERQRHPQILAGVHVLAYGVDARSAISTAPEPAAGPRDAPPNAGTQFRTGSRGLRTVVPIPAASARNARGKSRGRREHPGQFRGPQRRQIGVERRDGRIRAPRPATARAPCASAAFSPAAGASGHDPGAQRGQLRRGQRRRP